MGPIKLTQKMVDGLKGTEKLVCYFDENLTGFGVYCMLYDCLCNHKTSQSTQNQEKLSEVKYGSLKWHSENKSYCSDGV